MIPVNSTPCNIVESCFDFLLAVSTSANKSTNKSILSKSMSSLVISLSSSSHSSTNASQFKSGTSSKKSLSSSAVGELPDCCSSTASFTS